MRGPRTDIWSGDMFFIISEASAADGCLPGVIPPAPMFLAISAIEAIWSCGGGRRQR